MQEIIEYGLSLGMADVEIDSLINDYCLRIYGIPYKVLLSAFKTNEA